jgi:hypothetical protein
VKPHHLTALLHEFEFGIGRQPFQWPMQPFPAGIVGIHQPQNWLDNCILQALNGINQTELDREISTEILLVRHPGDLLRSNYRIAKWVS